MPKAIATIIVAVIFFLLPMSTVASIPTAEKQNQYFIVLERLSELPLAVADNSELKIQGYDDIIICRQQDNYIVIALPNDSEMLGLIRWQDGEVLNLYPAGTVDWPSDWPINYALALCDLQGKEAAQKWLNNKDFDEFVASRRFIWWSNSIDERIIISEDWHEEYATLLIDGRVYYAVGRWNPTTTSVDELSSMLAVL